MIADPVLTTTSQLVLLAIGILIGIFIGTSITLLANLYSDRHRHPQPAPPTAGGLGDNFDTYHRHQATPPPDQEGPP
jgi:hypothetical protein